MVEEEIETIDAETGEELASEYYEGLGIGYPKPRKKDTVIEFLNKVFKTKDSTKVSFMSDEEIDALRILQDAALYADMMGFNLIKEYLMKKSEIVAAPTLGRAGNLVNAAITTKKEFKAGLKTKPNKGWFKKKKEG